MAELLVLLLIGLVSAGLVSLILVLQLRKRIEKLEMVLRKFDHLEPKPQPSTQLPASAQAQVPSTAAVEVPVAQPFMPGSPGIAPVRISATRAAGTPDTSDELRPAGPSAEPAAVKDDRIASFEYLVGTRWLNWVGALVMLVGIAFLLKFLYDRGWIGPAGRVAIGMGFGVSLLILSEIKLRRLYDLLSQSVSASGCGALFLTTFLAFKFYDFSGRMATFALLCWFAAFTVILAILRRGRILAFLGLLGAYLTPYLLSTGQDQAEGLFAYLAVLALAVIGIQLSCCWQGIPSLCLALNFAYYASWFSRFYYPERLPIAVAGAAGLILLSGASALARGLWKRNAVRMEECIVLAAAAILGLYYLWDILVSNNAAPLGFILCGIAMVYSAAIHAARARNASTPMLENLLLGLAAGSLLLVIPACLKADGAMLAWAFSAVIFSDTCARSRSLLLGIAVAVCLVAGPWVGMTEGVGHTGVFIPIVNRIFLAWFCVVVAWFVAGLRFSRTHPSQSNHSKIGFGLQIASTYMLVALLTYEVLTWFRGQQQLPGLDIALLLDWRTVTLCLLWALYPCIYLAWAKLRPKLWTLVAAHYAVLGIAWLTLLTDLHHREAMVFLNPVLIAAVLLPAGMLKVSNKITDVNPNIRATLQIFAHLMIVALISVELYQGLFLSGWSLASREWIRMALISAAWSVYATAVLSVGIFRNLRSWRWLALGLLGATLWKVFFIDMVEVRQIWRVLSFIVLGALLMACSYAYSRHGSRKRLTGQPPT